MTRLILILLAVNVTLATLAGVARAQDPLNDGIASARALVSAGKIDEGLAALRILADDNPDNRLPHWWLASLLYQKAGKNREAAEVIGGFLEHHPDDEYALRLLKEIAFHSLEAGDALVTRWCIKYLIRFEPNEKNNYYLAALASYRLGDRPAARGACRELISRWPSFGDAHQLLAKVYVEEGQFVLAAEAYRALIEEKPGFARARLWLANILRAEFRDYDGAEEELRSALALSEPGSVDHDEAERGLAQIRADRALAERLRSQRSTLQTLLFLLLAGAAVGLGVATFLTRVR